MNISRTKFVIIFVVSAFAFQFITNSIFGSEVRLFPVNSESFLGTESRVAWKNVGNTILFPIKLILVGPMLPFVNFLSEDPPPPFIAIGFAFYWTILASVIYYLLSKIKNIRNQA